MGAFNVRTSAARAAMLMVAGCGGPAFSVAVTDPGPTKASSPDPPASPEGSADLPESSAWSVEPDPDGGSAADASQAAVSVVDAADDGTRPAEASQADGAPGIKDAASLPDVNPSEASPPLVDAGTDTGPADDGGPTIFRNWIYTNSANTDGYILSLKRDGTYELQRFLRTAAGAANDEIETGTFSAAASALTFTPLQWSCRGADPAYTTPYALAGIYLDVTYVIGLIGIHVDATADFAPQVGCFAKSGAFTPSPLAPVAP